MDTGDSVLVGNGMIITHARRGKICDISEYEWTDIRVALAKSKTMINEQFQPNGYNVGWNNGGAVGMSISRPLHLIPRFAYEGLAGNGIRHHLK